MNHAGHIRIVASPISALQGHWAITRDGLASYVDTLQTASVNLRAIVAEQGPRLRARDAHRAAGARLLSAHPSTPPEALRTIAAHTVWGSMDDWFDPSVDAHIRPHENGARVIGVLPMDGALMTKASWCWDGYDSLTASGRALIALGADDIVMMINGPGGACQGLHEFCAEVRAWRAMGIKVYAVVSYLCASAHYAIAAQADAIFVSPSSLTGSMGTYSQWVDIAGMLQKEGIRVGYVSRGEGKTAGASDDTETAQSERDRERMVSLEPTVQHFYDLFAADVAEGRGDRLDMVRTGARIFPGASAIEAGLADVQATFEELVTALEAGEVPALEVA